MDRLNELLIIINKIDEFKKIDTFPDNYYTYCEEQNTLLKGAMRILGYEFDCDMDYLNMIVKKYDYLMED